MNIDPKLLVQLSVLVEQGSFQSAADKLALTQPALSRNMRVLEERVGAQIFRREGRRSVPNDLGLKLARSGMAIRTAQEQAVNLASLAASGVAGQLRIGAPPLVAGRFITDALSRFIIGNPNCKVALHTGLVHELRSMLARGQVDIVFGPRGMEDPDDGAEFTPLIDDRVAVVCRAQHPLSRLPKVSATDLMAHSWLAHSRGSLLRQQTDEAMIASGVHHMHIVCETDSVRAALEVVAGTDLLTSIPKEVSKYYVADKLIFLPFDHPQFHRPIGIFSVRDMPLSPVVSGFLQQLLQNWNSGAPVTPAAEVVQL